jgi:drug/metabolite transporter (DMT)-like permease
VTTPRSTDRPLAGIAFMIVGVGVFSLMDASGKFLVDTQSVFQIVAFRGVISILLLAPILFRSHGIHLLRARRPGGLVLRSSLGVGAMLLFFIGIRYIPLADAAAIGFSGAIFMTAMSAILLREAVGWRRWVAVLTGFAGALIIAQPGSDSFHWAGLLMIGCALLYAGMMTMTRLLTRTDSNAAMVFYHSVISALVGLVALPFVWVTPTWGEFLLLCGMGVLATAGHILLAQAFRIAPIAVLAPFEYTALAWAALLGFLVWGDVPGSHVWIGAAILILSGLYILYREAREARASAAKAEAA